MRIATVVIILLLLCGVGICAESQHQNNPEIKPTKAQQMASDKQRGSEQSPIVVKIIPPKKDKVESDAAAKEKEEKKSLDSRLVFFTACLAAIGLLQLIVFGLQARRLSQTVEATEKAVKSAQDSERPYIFVRVEGDIGKTLVDGFVICKCGFFVRNHGKTPAILTNVSGQIWWGNDPPPPIDEPTEEWIPRGGAVIAAGKFDSYPTERKMDELEARNFETGVTLGLLCYGRIDYKDIFGIPHYTKFCWEFQNRVYEKGFYLSKSKELNDYT